FTAVCACSMTLTSSPTPIVRDARRSSWEVSSTSSVSLVPPNLVGLCGTVLSDNAAPPRVFSFQAEDGIRDRNVTGVQTCALPIYPASLDCYANPCNMGRYIYRLWAI